MNGKSPGRTKNDVVIIGSGPNGLSAGILLAKKGLSVRIVEARDTIGGGMRSAELTLPGFVHDICSTIHPLALGSPFFRDIEVEKLGVEFAESPATVAHPIDERRAALLFRSIDETSANLAPDGDNYQRQFRPLAKNWKKLVPELLAPLHIPKYPYLLGTFGLKALMSARFYTQNFFKAEMARAAFAGCAAHSMIPLTSAASASFGLVLTMLVHAVGWPLVRGGSMRLAKALGDHFVSLGGKVDTGHRVENIDEFDWSGALLFDLTPRQIIKIAGHRLPHRYQKKLEGFRYGAGVFKIDYALSRPVPWRLDKCSQAATVHLGGTFDEIARSEQLVGKGRTPEQPFVIFTQTSLFDRTRAPDGKHTGWAYCHLPNGSTVDMTEPIERQIERFAPGFRDCVLERHVMSPTDMESYDSNYIGGDINGGAAYLSQLFTRPVAQLDPYHIPGTSMFICSSSTPPGGGVHGMCGYHAANSVLSRLAK